MTENPASSVARVRIWDVPTRLVHWLIVASVATSWWTAERGDLELHRYSGYLLLGLLLFRIYWGFAGSSSARFAHFVKGPRAIARSEEHTSELQSRENLVCRLLLEKKNRLRPT